LLSFQTLTKINMEKSFSAKLPVHRQNIHGWVLLLNVRRINLELGFVILAVQNGLVRFIICHVHGWTALIQDVFA